MVDENCVSFDDSKLDIFHDNKLDRFPDINY